MGKRNDELKKKRIDGLTAAGQLAVAKDRADALSPPTASRKKIHRLSATRHGPRRKEQSGSMRC